MLYDIEIHSEDEYLATIEGIKAADPESACDDPQVWEYVRQIRAEHPNAMPARVIDRTHA